MDKLKAFFKENGFTSVVVLAVAVAGFILGKWFVFWGCLGFFTGKNWEIIYKLWKEDYKDKVEDTIDRLKK